MHGAGSPEGGVGYIAPRNGRQVLLCFPEEPRPFSPPPSRPAERALSGLSDRDPEEDGAAGGGRGSPSLRPALPHSRARSVASLGSASPLDCNSTLPRALGLREGVGTASDEHAGRHENWTRGELARLEKRGMLTEQWFPAPKLEGAPSPPKPQGRLPRYTLGIPPTRPVPEPGKGAARVVLWGVLSPKTNPGWAWALRSLWLGSAGTSK
uniref:uncharacterized protein LOC120886219 n=1 Tax=Ictidomys tridecemlineatus TaxID=43179 RepID=UPI001A9CECF0|nr:uncharacterized protein LOC120886219 [Ictidomys tridecemlineatus]